jgi:CBS domain containing-hemolysin-like protein
MIEVLLILIALALVAACGAFVAAEFAFITVDRSTVERAAEEGDRRAAGVLVSLRSLSTQLSAAQIGITVTNLLIGFIAEPSIAHLIDGPLASIGLGETAAEGVAVAIALLLATVFTMLFGELVPKNLAIAQPLATAKAVQAFHRTFTAATRPIVRLTNGSANVVVRRLGFEPQEELASARSPEELSSLVRRSAQEGTLEPATAALLERSLAFGERNAHDVMTPRGRLSTVELDDTALAVVQRARESGHSRFPVFDGQDVAGIAHLKDAVAIDHARRATATVASFMTPPVLVPASLDLDALLQTLRDGGAHMAMVVDEFGNVDGIVTLEDLIEEIVGELHDEHDADEEEQESRLDSDGSWVLSGLTRPDEVIRRIGVVLPEGDDYETLGGLLALELGRMPEPGDSISLEVPDTEHLPHRVTLTVVDLEGLRVDHVRLRAVAIERPEEDA